MATTQLNYTVPFLIYNNKDPKLIIDKIGINNDHYISKKVYDLIVSKIDLTHIGGSVPKEVAVNLISEQYDVCLNYIFSNPIWEKIREGKGREILLAYIIENRHYLFAASSRMSAGIGLHAEIKPYSFILSEHLIEEADHSIFFEDALEVMGCDKKLIYCTKPSPITIEWIYLMRTLGSKHPLVSAACSGLMESSAKNQEVVKNWHKMLMDSGIISSEAVKKFYRHVELDIELGHGSCWEEAILSSESISTELLKDCLNSITIVADHLYRWFASLDSGLSGLFVELLADLKNTEKDKSIPISIDNYFDGYPIFSSEIIHNVCYGNMTNSRNVSEVISLGYYLVPKVDNLESNRNFDLPEAAKEVISKTQIGKIHYPNKNLFSVINSWMVSINGHKLWTLMLEQPTVNLIYGYIFENYHYLNSSVSHTSSAIYACTNYEVRTSLIKHLEEEEKHSEILNKALKEYEQDFLSYKILRPLPTTILFTGFLKELALTDWKAYCIAIAFLQLTIEPNSSKHENFYSSVIAKNPVIASLLLSIKQHDILDTELSHTDDIKDLLVTLERIGVEESSLRRASQICTLTWSFLDGIRDYYKNNNSVNTRIGWVTNNNTWN
jgi:pyrroloquinoline quinone (PQQ) biosynthesis protein C